MLRNKWMIIVKANFPCIGAVCSSTLNSRVSLEHGRSSRLAVR